MLFRADGWIEPKLGMNRSMSEKIGTVHVQTTQKLRKTARSSLKTGTDTNTYAMKEEDIVDECEPASVLALS